VTVECEPADNSPPGGWPTPQSAYLHVPFCRHRCGYCNFSVVAGRDDLAERFLAAIDRELALLNRPRVETIFVGGGTPTHLSLQQLEVFLACLHRRFELAADCEWTIEANPEDINDRVLDVLVDHGVNRISLGVQSFDRQKLQTLERSHSGSQASDVIERVAQRITNVSIDLIFAAPDEPLETWQRDVDTALALPITHLSSYALTFEKGTMFWNRQRRGELSSADELAEVQMYEHVRSAAAANNLTHYEISNFAFPNSCCRHNLAYWQGRGWFAAGPGAASFVDGRREVNHRSTTTYLQRIEAEQSPVAEAEAISKLQYARERAAFGIRMLDGIDLKTLSVETGVELSDLCAAEIEQCLVAGLLTRVGSRLKLTERGILFADTVASAFLG
jgi:oxygen-independent coproporphyrinogen-3 oxidase